MFITNLYGRIKQKHIYALVYHLIVHLTHISHSNRWKYREQRHLVIIRNKQTSKLVIISVSKCTVLLSTNNKFLKFCKGISFLSECILLIWISKHSKQLFSFIIIQSKRSQKLFTHSICNKSRSICYVYTFFCISFIFCLILLCYSCFIVFIKIFISKLFEILLRIMLCICYLSRFFLTFSASYKFVVYSLFCISLYKHLFNTILVNIINVAIMHLVSLRRYHEIINLRTCIL